MTTQIQLLKADIVTCRVEAIVNAANTTLLGGGGVDGAIHRAAGALLLEECKTLRGCSTGEARLTKGYQLPAKFVIHTVGPVWVAGSRSVSTLLSSCYRNSLELAVKNNIVSLAFPSISTGAYGYPIEEACPIALGSVKKFLASQPAALTQIMFVLFSDKDLNVYMRHYPSYFP